MQLLDHNGNALDSSSAPQAPKQLARRDFLSKGMKLTAGGVLAPSLLGQAMMGASSDAEAQTVGAALLVYEGNNVYKYSSVSSTECKVYSNNVYIGTFKRNGTYGTIVLANGQSKVYNTWDRELQARPAIKYPLGSNGTQQTLKCYQSIYGLAKLASTGATYCTAVIYDCIAKDWDSCTFNISTAAGNADYKEYIGYLTAAANAEATVLAGATATVVGTISTIGAAYYGFAPAAIAAGLGAFIAGVTVRASHITLLGAYANLQGFRAKEQFIPMY